MKKKELTEEELLKNKIRMILNCEPEQFYNKYKAYKDAEAEFKKIYEPFKESLIDLYKKDATVPNTIMVGNAKLTYVSPSTRTTIDSKKLREEEPEIAKKFTKITNVDATIKLEGGA